MKKQAAVTAAPGAPGDRRVVVECENPNCKLNQFMTKNGRCRKCRQELPSSVAIQGAPFVPRQASAEMAMQLALGERLREHKAEPF